jgi:hypothetical protein
MVSPSTTLIPFFFLLLMCQAGCVSIQPSPFNASISQSHHVSSVSEAEWAGAGPDSCTLYDRTEVAKQWAARLNPARLVPRKVVEWSDVRKNRISTWVGSQRSNHEMRKAALIDWFDRKKEEANPAPWPRFHPVPTKPVFEPDEQSPSDEPNLYGRFGSN